MNAKDILTFLGIDGTEVESFDFVSGKNQDNGETGVFYVRLHPYEGRCPHCYKKNYVVKELKLVKATHSILAISREIYVFIYKRRYYCKECHKTFTQPFSLIKPRDRITYLTKVNIVNELYSFVTIKFIADRYNVSCSTVLRILDENIPYQKTRDYPGAICIDEFCFRHGNKKNKYPAVISNPFNKEVIDMIESRTTPYLDRYFTSIPIVKLYNVKYFISDMWEPYRNIRRKYFKNAIHIVDLFHIIKAFNDSITSIRVKILKNIVDEAGKKNKQYIFLKKNWKIFLMNRKKLEKIKKTNSVTGVVYYLIDKVDACLKEYPDLFEVYWNRENFIIEFNKVDYYKQAETLINFSINKFNSSLLKEVNEIGKMFMNWKSEIINAATKSAYGYRITNSISESNNNFIQTYIDLCYGVVNFERLRKRVMMISEDRRNKRGK